MYSTEKARVAGRIKLELNLVFHIGLFAFAHVPTEKGGRPREMMCSLFVKF